MRRDMDGETFCFLVLDLHKKLLTLSATSRMAGLIRYLLPSVCETALGSYYVVLKATKRLISFVTLICKCDYVYFG